MKLDKTEKTLENLRKSEVFGDFAVYVNYRGEEIFISSEGVNELTYFDVASMGKVLITSTLILRAIGERKLSLDSVLSEHFDSVPEHLKNVTVRHLLTHTSGIVRFAFSKEARNYDREKFAAMILSNPTAFLPGENMIYSCCGFNLLGVIAEKIYNETLEELFDRYIHKPLGLVRSSFRIAVDEPNAVICYNRQNAEGQRYDDANVRTMDRASGAGGQFWCVKDIASYLTAVMNRDERLYAPEMFDLAERDYTPKFSEGRGLGWLYVDGRYSQTGRLFNDGSFGHCGHTGISMFVSRKQDLRVIIASNTTRYASKKTGFKGYDYGDTMKMRAIVHNAIADDIAANRC